MQLMTRNAATLILLLAFTVGLAHAAQNTRSEPAYELTVFGTIAVAPDGSVHDFSLHDDLRSQVRDLLDRTVRSWQFEPILVDGQPVIATTRMRLDLEALPRGDDYVLQVADVSFGEPTVADNQPPEYPRDELMRGVGGKVVLVLKLDPSGAVEQTHVEQVSLTERLGKRAKYARRHFAKASREAAAGWVYDTHEIIDGEPRGTSIRVPVTFRVGNDRGWVERQDYIPGPVHPVPWGDPDERVVQADLDALVEGEIQSLSSRFELKNDVIGSVL